jgi:hypothetical protein
LKLESWSHNLDTKRAWLQARLEHLEATREILDSVIKDPSAK